MSDRLVIYPAAALFCARETVFNVLLTNELEQRYGYQSYLPQRDGFEFSKLSNHLKEHLEPIDISTAVEDIIYMADMGIFIPRSQVIVANLDEPLDPGVLVEIAHARALGKYIIGYRTDVRSPYGEFSAPLKGIHFFPAYQCHSFLFLTGNCRNKEDASSILDNLAAEIHSAISTDYSKIGGSSLNPSIEVQRLLDLAKCLFEDLAQLNTEDSLRIIAARYAEMRQDILCIRPKILSR